MGVSCSDKWPLQGKHGQRQPQPERTHRQELPTGRVWDPGVETAFLGRALSTRENLGRGPEALRKSEDLHPVSPCAMHETWRIKRVQAHCSEENSETPPSCQFWSRWSLLKTGSISVKLSGFSQGRSAQPTQGSLEGDGYLITLMGPVPGHHDLSCCQETLGNFLSTQTSFYNPQGPIHCT